MTISNEDRQTIIKYRAGQANEAIKEVEILINNGLLKFNEKNPVFDEVTIHPGNPSIL